MRMHFMAIAAVMAFTEINYIKRRNKRKYKSICYLCQINNNYQSKYTFKLFVTFRDWKNNGCLFGRSLSALYRYGL